jgi:hypothetical protein
MITRMGVYPIVASCMLVGALAVLLGQNVAVTDSIDNEIIPTAKVGLTIPFSELGGDGPGQEINLPWPGMQDMSCPGYCDSARSQCLIEYQKSQRVPRSNPACQNVYKTCVAKCSL